MRHKWNCNQCATPEGCTILGDESQMSLIPVPVCPFAMGAPFWEDAGEDPPAKDPIPGFDGTQ